MTVDIKGVVKNIGVFYVAQIINYALSFFFIVYTARYLGVEGFGVLSFAIAFTGIFGIFCDFGLRRVATREVARDRSLARKYIGNIFVIKIILGLITFILISICINLFNYSSIVIKAVYLLALSVIFSSLSQVFYAVFQAYEKMWYESLGSLLNTLVLLIGALLAINKHLGLLSFASLYFLSSLAVFIYSVLFSIFRLGMPHFKLDFNFYQKTIKEAWPFGLVGVFEIVYHWIDSVMLSVMKGNTVVGWYSAAYRLVFVALFLPSAVNMAIFPVMSRCYVTSEESLKAIYQKYFKYMSIIGIFIGVTTTMFADKIIMLIYGSGYENSIISLKILIWSSVLIFINGAFVRLFESINKQSVITKFAGVAAALNILLNIILIPRYSCIGASIATVISELAISICVIVAASKTKYKLRNSFIVSKLTKLSFAGIVTAICTYYTSNFNFIFLIIFSTSVYFGLVFLLREFDKNDLSLILNLK